MAAPDKPPKPSIRADELLVAPMDASRRGSGAVMGARSVVVVRAIVVEVVVVVVVLSCVANVAGG